MKKRSILLIMAMALMLIVMTACGGQTATTEGAQTGDKNADGNQIVTATDAVAAVDNEDIHIIDLRTWDNYSAGRLKNSEWVPIFPMEDDTLPGEMETYAKEHLMDGKKIYLVCNSGASGAKKATEVLTGAGIDPALIYTVEGGAKALGGIKDALKTDRTEDAIDWQYVSGADALKALEDGSAQIVDVRDDETYAGGHLKGSKQVALKEIESPEAQTAMYNLALAELTKDKPVYLLCYSGNKCAKTAISVMKDAGYDTNNVFIIKDGAKDPDIAGALVTE